MWKTDIGSFLPVVTKWQNSTIVPSPKTGIPDPMLSVLSSSTLNLSEELHRTREDLILSRFETAKLSDALAKKRQKVTQHLDSFWGVLKHHQDKVLKSKVLHAFRLSRQQVWRRPTLKETTSPSKTGLSGAAWRWLWQKKVFGLWRRGAALALRQRYKDEHHHQLTHHQNSVLELQENLERLHDRRVDTDGLLQSERARVQTLEAELAASQDQVKELQKRLKESFVKQFQSQTRQDELESHFSKLAADFRELKAENHRFEQELLKARADLQEAHGVNAEKENRLLESSSELSLAEKVIEDITSSKLVGLRRFFEHYDLPSVSLSLFCKVLELQQQMRNIWKGNSKERERLSMPMAIEKEVQHFSSHQVSRRALHAYLEGMNLTIPASMVAQVILALLGLDAPCDPSRFCALLLQPPQWQSGDFATALWGSAGEPAAALLAKRAPRNGRWCVSLWLSSHPRNKKCRTAGESTAVHEKNPKRWFYDTAKGSPKRPWMCWIRRLGIYTSHYSKHCFCWIYWLEI